MQLSTNSNWQTQHLVRSHPTWAGQYRQAYLQKQDRLWTAEDIQHSLNVQAEEIALLQLDLDELLEASTQVSGRDAQRLAHRCRLLQLEIERAQTAMERNRLRLRDCYREAEVCQAEMERICQESGLDFAAMEETEFQVYMAKEAQMSLAKNLAAAELSARTGLPMMATEAWMSAMGDSQTLEQIIQAKDQVMSKVTALVPESLRLLQTPGAEL